MTDDARRLAALLAERAGPARRVSLDNVWAGASDLWPDAVRRPDARAELNRHLNAASEIGLLELSVRKDRAGVPLLPAFVTLPAVPRPTAPQRARVAWHSALAWAAGVRLSERQHARLLAVDRWLRDGGPTRPMVPSEERSLELFDDEKAIRDYDGGDTLWGPGRLSLALLRCERTLTPFIWEATGTGSNLLVVENQATFHSIVRILRQVGGNHTYGGVVWGQGRMAASRIAYATKLPIPIQSLDYFGDLDVEGLEIAEETCRTANLIGLRAAPHIPLWARLLAARPVTTGTVVGPERAARAVLWLPEALRPSALEVLGNKKRIPQERIGFEQLLADRSWMENVSHVGGLCDAQR